jgi:hypothetical protein
MNDNFSVLVFFSIKPIFHPKCVQRYLFSNPRRLLKLNNFFSFFKLDQTMSISKGTQKNYCVIQFLKTIIFIGFFKAGKIFQKCLMMSKEENLCSNRSSFELLSYILFPSLLNNVFNIILKKLNTQYLRGRPRPFS